jgi:hypothetical protein
MPTASTGRHIRFRREELGKLDKINLLYDGELYLMDFFIPLHLRDRTNVVLRCDLHQDSDVWLPGAQSDASANTLGRLTANGV